MTCNHAASGCDYPAGECTGACLARPAMSQPAAQKRYLTIVYEIHSIGQERALLHAAGHEAVSYSNAIEQRDELLKALNEYREKAHRLVIQRGELLEAAATCRANFRRHDEETLKMAQAEDEERASLRTQRDELLGALKRLRHWAEADKVNYTGDHPVALARAAIAKAANNAK